MLFLFTLNKVHVCISYRRINVNRPSQFQKKAQGMHLEQDAGRSSLLFKRKWVDRLYCHAQMTASHLRLSWLSSEGQYICNEAGIDHILMYKDL